MFLPSSGKFIPHWLSQILVNTELDGTLCAILSWRIPWTEGPGGLQSVGLQRIGHS